MSAPFWKVLGIDPTVDEGDIRRAYAARLRVTNPEDDADGFKKLRTAYEQALQHLRYMQMRASYPDSAALEEDGASEEQAETEDLRAATNETFAAAVAPIAAPVPSMAHVQHEVSPRHPLEVERQSHDTLCQHLAGVLDNARPAEECVEALNAVMKSPAMQQVDVFAGTEGWLMHMLIASRPASDPLFEPAIEFFKWDEERVGSRNLNARQVLFLRTRIRDEREAARLLARIKDKRHEYHRAWKETLRPPSKRGWLNRLLSLRHTNRVIEFLMYVRSRAPVLLESMDRATIEWWRDRIPVARRARQVFGALCLVVVVALAAVFAPQVSRFFERKPVPQYVVYDPSSPEWAGRPPPRPAPRTDGAGPSLLDLLAPGSTDVQKRYAARRDCREAAKRLGKVPPGVKTFTTTQADVRCKKILEMTPDSLLMRQYAGIAALRLEEPETALEHFEIILKSSPDDAYALFGKGLVSTIVRDGASIGNPQDMSDALAMNPDVAPYFESFGLTAPDVEPSRKKPRSRLPKLTSIHADTNGEKLENPEALDGDGLSDHFGLDDTTDGVVSLECTINAKGRAVGCHIKSEEPANVGLGEVGLLAMDDIRYKPPTLDGEPVGGLPLRYQLTYQVASAEEIAAKKAAASSK